MANSNECICLPGDPNTHRTSCPAFEAVTRTWPSRTDYWFEWVLNRVVYLVFGGVLGFQIGRMM